MSEDALLPQPRLTIRPKSDIDRMTLVSALALFGINLNRGKLAAMDQEEKDWVLRDCRAVFLKRMKTSHPDHGGETGQAERLNLAFDRVTHLLAAKLLFVPREREYAEPPAPNANKPPKPPDQIRPARTLKQRLCVVCGNQCTKGRTTCSNPCLAQRRVSRHRVSPEQKRQNRRDYLARTQSTRKIVAAAWWAAHASQIAKRRRSPQRATGILPAGSGSSGKMPEAR